MINIVTIRFQRYVKLELNYEAQRMFAISNLCKNITQCTDFINSVTQSVHIFQWSHMWKTKWGALYLFPHSGWAGLSFQLDFALSQHKSEEK